MKKLQKVASLLLVVALICMCCCACGGENATETSEADSAVEEASDAEESVVRSITDYIEFYGIVPVTGEIQDDSSIKKGSLDVYILYKNITDKTFSKIEFSLKGGDSDSFFSMDQSFNGITSANCYSNDVAPGGPCENGNFTCFKDLDGMACWGYSLGVIRSVRLEGITISVDGETIEFTTSNGGLDGIQTYWKGFNYESDPSDFPL